MCQDCLVRGMNASNVCDRLRVAELFNAHKVKRKALQVFQRFRQSILESRVKFVKYSMFAFYR